MIGKELHETIEKIAGLARAELPMRVGESLAQDALALPVDYAPHGQRNNEKSQ